MSAEAALFLVGFLLIATARQLAFKGAAVAATRHRSSTAHQVRAPLFWAAVLSAPLEALLWLAFLSLVPLGQGMMTSSFSIVMVLFSGRLLFREHLTPARLGAASLITFGVALVAGK